MIRPQPLCMLLLAVVFVPCVWTNDHSQHSATATPFIKKWSVGFDKPIAQVSVSRSPIATLVTDGGTSLVGFSVDTGRTLWKVTETKQTDDNPTKYPVIWYSSEPVAGSVIASFSLEVNQGPDNYVWNGFFNFDSKTGRNISEVGLEFNQDTFPVALPSGMVLVVRYARAVRVNTLFLLRPPDFNFHQPVATLSWPSSGSFSSSSDITVTPHSDIVLQLFATPEASFLRRVEYKNLNHNNKTLEVRWTVPVAAGTLAVAQREDFVVSWTNGYDPPYQPTFTAYDMETGRILWHWALNMGIPSGPSPAGTVVGPRNKQLVCGLLSAFTEKPKYLQDWVYCLDPSSSPFAVPFNISIHKNDDVGGRFVSLFKQWVLILDASSGDLYGYDPFQGQPKSNDGQLPEPAWKLPGQAGLQGLNPSEDGSFVIAQYSDKITRYDVHTQQKEQ